MCAARGPRGGPARYAGQGAEDAGALTLALAGDFTRLVVPGDGVARRALRRRAAIRGIETSAEVAGPCVRLASATDPNVALDTLDGVVLDLDGGDLAVMLGPASVLCDELRGDGERKRAETLRPGNLGMALRLPRGMWREAHRQALGAWICAGARTTPAR